MSPFLGDLGDHRGNVKQKENDMKICTFYTTDRRDDDFIPAVIEATGETVDDLVPAITDEVAQEIAIAQEVGKTLWIEDQDGNMIDKSVFAVSEALANGATCIVLKNTLPTGEKYENVFTIHTI
jgi:hypothetical protein